MNQRNLKRRKMSALNQAGARIERTYRMLESTIHQDEMLRNRWRRACLDPRRPSRRTQLVQLG